MTKGIKAFIESCQELEVPYEKAFDKLMVKFELSKDEAESAIKKYWRVWENYKEILDSAPCLFMKNRRLEEIQKMRD